MKTSAIKIFSKFCAFTTIHGFQQLINPKVTFIERLLLITLIMLKIWGSFYLCSENLDRFEANPTVVSLQKDFRNWEFYFPAMTFCLVQKFEEDIIKSYLQSQLKINFNSSEFFNHLEFIKIVADMSLGDMENITRFRGLISDKVDLSDLLFKILPAFKPNLQPSDKFDRIVVPHMTEIGVCLTYNSFVGHYMQNKIKGYHQNQLKKSIMKCMYLDSQCYTRLETKDEPKWTAKLFIHSPFESIDYGSTNPTILKKGENSDESYDLLEAVSTDDLRMKLSPNQRKCRYLNEPQTDEVHVYSYSGCRMKCRQRFLYEKCKCTPHYYFYMGGKKCNVDGLICVFKYHKQLYQLKCDCPQPCDDLFYKRLNIKMKKLAGYLQNRISYRLGLTPSRMRMQRNIIFSFEDLIVSFGGIANLFLGISFLTIVETMYFICEHILNFFCG